MEDAGGRPDSEKVSKHPMVVRALRDIEVGLARGNSAGADAGSEGESDSSSSSVS